MFFAVLLVLWRRLRMDCPMSSAHPPRFPFFLSSWWPMRRSINTLSASVSTQTIPKSPLPGSPAPLLAPPTPPRTPPRRQPIRMSRETVAREANDDLDNLVGLDNVKRQLRGVQSWVKICRRHGRDPRGEWYNIAFQGNPGTGKTTVARIYAKLLYAMGIIDSHDVLREVTGAELAMGGIMPLVLQDEQSHDEREDGERGGRGDRRTAVVIIDRPYDIHPSNQAVLDELMEMMENPTRRTIAIFTGDSDAMDDWLRAQPRLRRLTCSSVRFADFDRDELQQLLGRDISHEFQGRMTVEGGLDGPYMQVAARRLARARATRGFTNVYAVRDFVATVARRQAVFLTEQQDRGLEDVDHFFLSKEDLLGLRPMELRDRSEAWMALQKLVGHDAVKASIQEVVDMAEGNYWREIQGQKRLPLRLNRVFAGPRGTGKTTAARFYAQILADLGFLPTGKVALRRPSDEDIIADMQSIHDRVLVVNVDEDEIAGLSAAVLDALTERLLVPLEQHGCTVLVGPQEAIQSLLSDSRGPRKSTPVVVQFQPFSRDDLEQLVALRLKEQDLTTTPDALQAALDILDHLRVRRDFDHARTVDHLLVAAHRNFIARQAGPVVNGAERVLEAEDFSLELANVRSALAFRDELRHTVVADDIISVLKRYHNEMKAAWLVGQNPAERMASAFVFKGACGTGKKTVARQLAALYYRMGILSSETVIDCSVTDLLLSTKGARAQFERSRGKILYIEDAHRLADTESTPPRTVDDLIYLIPRQDRQTVVILAGAAPEMDHLLANRPRLSALFQEEIVFRNPTPRECLRLLDRRLDEQRLRGARPYLTDPQSSSHREFTRAIHVLSMFPCWSNAKDIDVLARWMVSAAMRQTPLEEGALMEMQLSEEQAMACMIKLYNLKRDRLRLNQDPKARTLPRVLSQPRCTERTGVRFPV